MNFQQEIKTSPIKNETKVAIDKNITHGFWIKFPKIQIQNCEIDDESLMFGVFFLRPERLERPRGYVGAPGPEVRLQRFETDLQTFAAEIFADICVISVYILHYFIGHSPDISRHFKKNVKLKELEIERILNAVTWWVFFLVGSLHACCTGESSSSIPSSCRPPGRPENLKLNMIPTLKRTFHRIFQVSNTRPLQEETSKDIFRPRCFGVAFALLH